MFWVRNTFEPTPSTLALRPLRDEFCRAILAEDEFFHGVRRPANAPRTTIPAPSTTIPAGAS